jgi:cobalt-zinc-cadmium efflux system outer membrane protein
VLSISRAGCRCAIMLAACAALQANAIAAPTLPDNAPVTTGPLTLERALDLASRYGLTVHAAGARAQAARARVEDAGRRPNPTLNATEENFGGQLGTTRREGTLAMSQVLELGGDRRAREGIAEAESKLASAEVGTVGREGLAQTAERFISAWSLQARLARLREGEALTEQAIRAATDRFRAGGSPRLEILRAQSRARTQAVERQRTESELTVARRELALSWGAMTATFDSLVAPEPVMPRDTVGWQLRVPEHPALARAAAAEGLASARIQAASAARKPDLTVSGGVRRLEEVPGTGFVLGVEVPLPLWNRGNGSITAAHRELEAAAAERQATEQGLQVAFAAASERFMTAAAIFDTLRLHARPEHEAIVDELLRGYRSGRSSYLDLVAEQSNLLETELALIDAQADLWRAQLRLESMAGIGLLTPKEKR